MTLRFASILVGLSLLLAAAAGCDGDDSKSNDPGLADVTDTAPDAADVGGDADVEDPGDGEEDTADADDADPGDAPDVADAATDPDASDAEVDADAGTDADADVAIDVAPDLPIEPPVGEATEFGPSEGFLARQQEYYDTCLARTVPPAGGIYGQVCRVAEGGLALDVEEIERAIAHIEERRDTSDFRANALVRFLYLDDESGGLGDMRDDVHQTLFEFKYWIDQPGEDGMAYWTENHQILFHTAELLMGQRLKDTVFPNSGMTGQEHMDHALPRIRRWLEMRGRYGFSEWHSNVYFNEDVPALLNLVDFAEDEEIREGARMVLDIILVDLATNMFQGVFATTAGRTYEGKYVGGSGDSTREFAWIGIGQGELRSADNFGATFLATSSYYPPPIIERLAAEIADGIEHRQRDSWSVEEADQAGVGLEGLDEIVLWAGQSNLVHPDLIDGAMEVMEEYDLWDGFLFGSLPDSVLSLLRSLIGTPQLRALAEELEPLSVGIALDSVDNYVYRTPDYQMAAAQDWKPGLWSAQTLLYRASIAGEVSVLTTAPGSLGGLTPDGVTADNPWIGGFHPRLTAYRNAAIIQYARDPYAPLNDSVVAPTYVHAYFPVEMMEEWRAEGQWLFGRVDDGYVGLWSQLPIVQSEEESYDWIVDATTNVFVLELGSAAEHGDFDTFVASLSSADVSLTEREDTGYDVVFESPTLGRMEAGWRGDLLVDGEAIDLGPYERWDNEYVTQRRGGSRVMDVVLDDEQLRLDFRTFERTLYVSE